jgi:hypothetical protein
MWSTVAPQMKVDVKRRSDHSVFSVNLKTHFFREDRETKVIGAQNFDMEIRGTATQTRLKSQGN